MSLTPLPVAAPLRSAPHGSQSRGYRHVVHRLREPEEFGLALSGASLIADFLAPQALPTRVEQFQTPGWTLDFHEAHVKARICGPLPPGWVSLGFMRSAAESSWHGFAAQQGVIMVNPPGEGLDGRIAPGFASMAVNVPLALWEQGRALAGAEHDFAGVTALHLPPPLYAQLEHELRAVRQRLRTGALCAAREAAAFATRMFTLVWELSGSAEPPRASLRNRARLARRAEAWLRAHLAKPVQVPELCLALRVSRRELEYAFRSVFDQSPRDFLQALRLNAIHRALRRAEAPLAQIAFAHGVTHLSRFAAHYRALFGENPSRTQRLDPRQPASPPPPSTR